MAPKEVLAHWEKGPLRSSTKNLGSSQGSVGTRVRQMSAWGTKLRRHLPSALCKCRVCHWGRAGEWTKWPWPRPGMNRGFAVRARFPPQPCASLVLQVGGVSESWGIHVPLRWTCLFSNAWPTHGPPPGAPPAHPRLSPALQLLPGQSNICRYRQLMTTSPSLRPWAHTVTQVPCP